MNFSIIWKQKSIPYLITFFLITTFFSIGSIYPYQIQTDVAAQIKSIQQWLAGESNLFYSLVIANPQDLSQNLQCWLLWWPPGIAIAFLPLIAIGLPLGVAVKITAYFLFVLGSIGWLKLVEKLQFNFLTVVLFSILLPFYCLGYATTYLASNLNGGDILPFAIMPWVFSYTLYITIDCDKNTIKYSNVLLNYSCLGFVLGIFYWIKYAAFAGSLAILIYIIILELFFNTTYSLKKRFYLIFATIIFTFIPFLTLNIINKSFAGIDSAVTLISDTINISTKNTRGIGLLLSLLGAQGLSLFQSVDLFMHLTFFSEKAIPIFSSYSPIEKQRFLVITGIPGSLLVSYFIFYSRKLTYKKKFVLTLCVSFIPFIILAYLTFKLNHNFLAGDVARLTSSFFIFTEIIAVSAFLDWLLKLKNKRSLIISYIGIILFLIMPNFFVFTNFTKNYVWERIGSNYIPTENQLYVPNLSKTNVKSIVNQINDIVINEKDVVVLATEYGTSYEAWLEIKHRTIPIFDWWAVTSKIRDSKIITTSQDLRVVLVIPKYLEKDKERILELKQRFPQATKWSTVENPSKSDTSVFLLFSDLKVK